MTASEVLTVARRLGVEILPDGEDGVRMRGRRGALDELRELIRRVKPEILEILRVGATEGPARAVASQPTPAPDHAAGPGYVETAPGELDALDSPARSHAEWDSETAELIGWFKHARATGQLPAESFALAPHIRVLHPARWYAALAADVAAGPRGARARVLADDLRGLRLWTERRRDDAADSGSAT